MSNIPGQSSDKPRIAIFGASGRVGSTLTNLLARDPVEIVALTRRPDAVRLPTDVNVVTVDFERLKTLQDALLGVDRLFIAHGTSPQQRANEIALIDAAVAAGVGHIVKLSAMGPATRLNPCAWHMEIEAYLAHQPVASTVLRPTAFADILKRFAVQISRGEWTAAAGNGRVNFIDTRDVAEVARIALLEEVFPESQRAYHLTGPRSWTMQQVSDEFSTLFGHPVIYSQNTPEQQRALLISSGISPFVAGLLVDIDQMFRESVLGETTSTVQELTGKAPRPLPAWLAENVSFFRSA